MSSAESSLNTLETEGSAPFKVDEVVLKPCYVCGRSFNLKSLERHEKVCENTKKVIRRNVFNSFSQRTKELGPVPVPKDAKEEEKKFRKSKEVNGNTSHISNKGSNVMNNGLSQNKQVPSGYQQCPSCNRYFNHKAAERHIVWCVEQQSRLAKTPTNSEALDRLKARVKYKAPLPKKKLYNDSNIRLIKSAESIRELSMLRTHSSPPVAIHDLRPSIQNIGKHSSGSTPKSESPMKVGKNTPLTPSNSCQAQDSNISSEAQCKKAVKFKEIFPVHNKERNKNLDMLATLRLRLSELETSDDFLDDCFIRSNQNEALNSQVKQCNFPNAVPVSKQMWASDGEVNCSTSSSSDGSLPSLSHDGSSDQCMPRYCYNCGTKYPVVSAKFCCECGVRRFVISTNNNQLYVM